ncbi:Manganese/iron superoxide dismutase [Xylariaceae sp. FL0016]|nr:Manganese/iron superoxide dismutase [Xylariaceae sp. FL0016]
MLRPRLRIPRVGALLRQSQAATICRSYHTPPALDQFNAAEGVPGLLSADGYHLAWTAYMGHVTEKLNRLTAGTDFEQTEAVKIVKSTAREPSQASVFNYASMAHNSHFFFKNLANLNRPIPGASSPAADATANPDAPAPAGVPIPERLRLEIEKNFSSVETLRREFLLTALGMFGPGFVWLVKNSQSQDLRILTTYLAGSPYTAAHWRRQGLDMNTASGDLKTASEYLDRNKVGYGNSKYGRFEPTAPGGVDVIPLLCLNTWEHVWLRDYGIEVGGQGGKRQFVENWWYCIDWNKVEHAAGYKAQNNFV